MFNTHCSSVWKYALRLQTHHSKDKNPSTTITRAAAHLTASFPTFNPGADVVSNLILIAILAVMTILVGFGISTLAGKHAAVKMTAIGESARDKALRLKDTEKGISS